MRYAHVRSLATALLAHVAAFAGVRLTLPPPGTASQSHDFDWPSGSCAKTPFDPLLLPATIGTRIALYQLHHPLETRPVENRPYWRDSAEPVHGRPSTLAN